MTEKQREKLDDLLQGVTTGSVREGWARVRTIHIRREHTSRKSFCGKYHRGPFLTPAGARSWKDLDFPEDDCFLCKTCFRAMVAEGLRDAHAAINRYSR